MVCNINNIDVDWIKDVDKITEAKQNAGEATSDGKIFTSQAAAKRFDTPVGSEPAGPHETGRTWFANDADGTVRIWNGSEFKRIARDGAYQELITEAQQDAGEATGDGSVFTSQAAARRFDTFVQTSPPSAANYEIGKTWVQNDNNKTLSIWDGTTWLSIASGGSFLLQPTIIYVDSVNGNDVTFDGHRIINPMKTIKAAVAQANTPVAASSSSISAGTYNNTTGLVTLTTSSNHGLAAGQAITLANLLWTCTDGSGSATFPEAGDPQRFVASVISNTQFTVQMEPTAKAHQYTSGGTVSTDAGFLGDGWVIYCAPGVYMEEGPITIQARNLSIVGASIRSTFIHPTSATEEESLFLADSGFYLTNFTIAGLKASGARGGAGSVDPDATYGLPGSQAWAVRFREAGQPAGAPAPVIRKSPYIQNCTHFADSGINNDNFNPANLPGEGGDTSSDPCGGGILIDGAAVAANSPLRSFVVDSFTQIALNGPGCLATNNGYAQLVSFFGTFCWYHAKSIKGGQLNLSNCTTDFGQYGLVAHGKSSAPIMSATVDSIVADKATIIPLRDFTKGTLWEPPRVLTPADHMVVKVNGVLYPILTVATAAHGYDVTIFKPAGEAGDADAFTNGGVDGSISAGTTAQFYLQSYVSTAGHTFEYAGSGTDYSAHPDFGGVPDNTKQTVELGGEGTAGSRLAYVNGGRVWRSSTDENGNFSVGETLTVNQKTGEIIVLPEAIVQDFIVRDDIDLRGFGIIQDPSNAGSDTPIRIEPSGTGQIVLGSTDVDSNGDRIKVAPILAPIREADPDGFNYDVVSQKDLGYDPGEIPLSSMLGRLAFTDKTTVISLSNNIPGPDELSFKLNGNDLIISVTKTDGTSLSATITLS